MEETVATAATEAGETIAALAPEHLEPIYEALNHIQTLDIALLCAIGLAAGAVLGLALWRWLR